MDGREEKRSVFVCGRRVKLEGLRSASEHNGTWGTVEASEGARIKVKLDNGRTVSVKKENLFLKEEGDDEETVASKSALKEENLSKQGDDEETVASNSAFYKERRREHRAKEKVLRSSCENCGKEAPLKCSKCAKSTYCSSACAAVAWTKGGHKKICGYRCERADNMSQLLGEDSLSEWCVHYARTDAPADESTTSKKVAVTATGTFDYYKNNCVSLATTHYDHCTTCDPVLCLHFTNKDSQAEKGLVAVRWTDDKVHWVGFADFVFPDPRNREQYQEIAISLLLSRIVPGIDHEGRFPDGSNGIPAMTQRQTTILQLYISAIDWLANLHLCTCDCKKDCQLQLQRRTKNKPKSREENTYDHTIKDLPAYPKTHDQANHMKDRLDTLRHQGPSQVASQYQQAKTHKNATKTTPSNKKKNKGKKKTAA